MSNPKRVYFFGTCLIDLFYPEAGISAIELIEREGISVDFPQQQTCCGQPPFNSGYNNEAISVASKQIALLGENIPVIVPSASCAGMMKHHYPKLFANHHLSEKALALSSRVYELTEFLVRVLNISLTDYGSPIKVAMHTSCSARREMEVTEDGLSLLRQLKNLDLCEPAEPANVVVLVARLPLSNLKFQRQWQKINVRQLRIQGPLSSSVAIAVA